MENAIKQFEEIIARVDENINQALTFKKDIMEMYGDTVNIDDVIKIQSMVLKIDDYVSQKRMTRVEIERQLEDYKEAYAKEQANK